VSKGSPLGGYFCIPLAARGETLSMLPGVSACSGVTSSGAATDPMAILERQALAAGERRSLVQLSYGDLLAVDKTARPPVTDPPCYNVAVCACFPPNLHYGIQTLLCRSLLFNVSKQQFARSK